MRRIIYLGKYLYKVVIQYKVAFTAPLQTNVHDDLNRYLGHFTRSAVTRKSFRQAARETQLCMQLVQTGILMC